MTPLCLSPYYIVVMMMDDDEACISSHLNHNYTNPHTQKNNCILKGKWTKIPPY